MRKNLLASLVALLIGGAAAILPAAAIASPGDSIGLTGRTSWFAELNDALARMNDFGVPIHNGCNGAEKLCVHVDHYRKADRLSGYFQGDRVWVNDQYDNGMYLRRVSLWMHELGHAAGLDHSDNCDSSMYHTFPACGSYFLGYNAHEQQQIREKW